MFLRKLYSILMVSIITLSGIGLFAMSHAHAVDITSSDAFTEFKKKTGYKDNTQTLPQVVGSIVKQLMGLLGVLFAIYLIYGGVEWLIAGGNAQRLEKAKNIIINGIIGLIVTLSAYAISYFIVDVVLSSTGTK